MTTQGLGSDGGLREGDLLDRPPAADPQDGEQGSSTQARSEPEPLRPDEQETLKATYGRRGPTGPCRRASSGASWHV